jgi:hypothetical protein
MKLPQRDEAAEYYWTYIDKARQGDLFENLAAQSKELLQLLGSIGEDASLHRYAPDKWTIREVVGHLNDTERVFTTRAFWFARAFDTPLPSFDQNVAVGSSGANERSLQSHLDEFRAVRSSTIALFENLPPDAWDRRGIASGNPFTVRALAYMCVGHVTHHVQILKEKYLAQSVSRSAAL